MLCASKVILSAVGLFCAVSASAQRIRQHTLLTSSLVDSEGHKAPPTKRLFYQLDSAPSAARGLLVLLPGRGRPARGVFKETRLAQEAAQRGFVVVVLDLNNRICLNAADTRFLDEAIGQVVRQYPNLGRQLILGGSQLAA
jgi:poly(3-hydroxybutyrate) depolymerase